MNDIRLDELLSERAARYGAFTDNAAISQALKERMRLTPR